jgi:hypothetical protein
MRSEICTPARMPSAVNTPCHVSSSPPMLVMFGLHPISITSKPSGRTDTGGSEP